MKSNKAKKSLIQQSRNIVLIFISLASLMIISALVELSQSKKELFQLMESQAHALLESLLTASNNSLLTNQYLEDLAKKRLMNNAKLVKRLYDTGNISNDLLKQISKENDIFRINIFNKQGQKIFSNHEQEHFESPEKNSPQQTLQPIFNGQTDTLIIGLKQARFKDGFRYAVAVATNDNGAIVLNIDAKHILDFKRYIGFGALLRSVVSDNPGIIYAALQDNQNILAASGNVKVLEAIPRSAFLTQSLEDSLFLTRTVEFDTLEVFEAVHPFSIRRETIGLFRVGLAMDPILEINQRIYRRLTIITIILVVLGSFMLTFIFTRQRYNLLQKQYQVVETYSGSIIDNVSDAIIVYDQKDGIKIYNSAAEKLFEKPKSQIIGKSLQDFLNNSGCGIILKSASTLQQISCTIQKQKKFLLASKSQYFDSEQNEIIILVIRDLTKQRKLEEQMQREQRLTAMGELASGVAHEIRNPLNTIGTIIQQLDKDFEPNTDKDEYHELAGLVHAEVKRINETVEDFLRFARPEPIQPETFPIQPFLDQIEKQYLYLLKDRNINITIKSGWQKEVFWDKRQIRQVFLNIIQNAIDAIDKDGNIWLTLDLINNNDIEIKFTDDGPGMSDDIRSNIFNLYFTTKAKGTGIGLSIVQRIIYEHGGIITVESEPVRGTSFIIRLPIQFKKNT
jgi:signal transduction histidine kinase